MATPDNQLTFGEILKVVATVEPILEREGIMDAAGNFTGNSIGDWTKVAADIEQELSKYLVIPAKVDQVIRTLPVILQLVGIT